MIATLGTLAPNKRSEIMRVAVRGYFSGSMICFLTASIAGVYSMLNFTYLLIDITCFLHFRFADD